MRLDYVSVPDPRKPPGGPHRVAIGIVGAGVQAEFRAIELYRDIYYVGSRDNVLPGSVWSSLKLGDDEFLAMGDNSPSSSDGRYWGAVPRKNLMGKGLLVFWPAWPLNFQCKFIR